MVSIYMDERTDDIYIADSMADEREYSKRFKHIGVLKDYEYLDKLADFFSKSRNQEDE